MAFARDVRRRESAARQVDLLKAIQQGMQERGAALGDDARALAAEV